MLKLLNCYLKCCRKCYNVEYPSILSITICNFPGKTSWTKKLRFFFQNLPQCAQMYLIKCPTTNYTRQIPSLMSLREANRRQEKNDSWVAIATRDRDILSPEALECIFSFIYLFFLNFLLRQTFKMYDDPRRGDTGKREGKRRRGEKVVYLHVHSDRSSLREHQAISN